MRIDIAMVSIAGKPNTLSMWNKENGTKRMMFRLRVNHGDCCCWQDTEHAVCKGMNLTHTLQSVVVRNPPGGGLRWALLCSSEEFKACTTPLDTVLAFTHCLPYFKAAIQAKAADNFHC